MSWTFDVESQSLYVNLSDGAIAGQIEMPDGTIVDVDAAGEALGIEVLRTWASWDLHAVAEQFNLLEDTEKYLEMLSRTVAMMNPRRSVREEVPVMRELVREQLATTANALEMATA